MGYVSIYFVEMIYKFFGPLGKVAKIITRNLVRLNSAFDPQGH